MLDQMRARTDDAHVAAEHVPELRNLVDAEFAKPFSERVNAFIAVARPGGRGRGYPSCMVRNFRIANSPVLHAGAGLDVEERAGRLETLRQPDDGGEDGKDEQA